MPTQLHLPVQPAGAREINAVVAMVERDEQVAYFASGVPLFIHRADDPVGRRVAAGQLIELGLARQEELSTALRVHRSTLYRQHRKLQAHGVLGVVDGQRGPRGPHRFTAEKRQRVAALLEAGRSIRHAAEQVGVTEGTIRHALRRGELQRAPTPAAPALGPRTRSEQAASAAGGVAVQRHTERALARLGQLTEAAPRFVAAEAVRAGGVVLALPAVLTLGLLDAGSQVYGALKHGFYGLQATLLCLTFMALLRIRTPEPLQGQPPGELGILLGLDRAPEVKPLRRKLAELAARRQATPFSQQLAERWVRDQADAVALLYIDGHVRPYHGTAHRLPETYVTRRRLCMPATTDIWVQQQDAQPLFVVTAPANDDLLAMLRTRILPEVRRLVGERRVTLGFDREGWSPKFFHECHAHGFDILTYRRGPYAAWPRATFRPITATVEGREIHYTLAERRVEVLPSFRMREVRRLCDNGHQTAILTTRQDLPIAVVAYRMFERWTQENFFRYMRQHFALDALLTYAVEPADPDRTIPNPARKALRKHLAEARATLKALEQEYGHAARKNPEGRRPTMRGFKIAHGTLGQQIRAQARECHRLEARIAILPERVPVKAVMDVGEIVTLAPEAKHLTDTIKMVAYRAETALVRCLAPHYAKTEDEGRALIREMLSSSADIIPEAKHLRIRLHSLANPRSNQALADVCATLNALELQYPGTTLTLVYEAPGVA
ncbi:MAG TPA: helix-turn-helix domain-containing protein [Candidatus Polarisedimenticolia bacterium]|nr:helix-turn-helix domain-containing protein [Candidatus Polarisedimenticolia bacterium]